MIKKNITQKELGSLRVNDTWKCDINKEQEGVSVIFVGRNKNMLTFAHKDKPARQIQLNVAQAKAQIWALSKGKRL